MSGGIMEAQSTEEKTNVYTNAWLSKAERQCFPTMTKEEIIERYIEIKSNLAKAEKKADYFYSQMIRTQEKYEYLNAKYPELDGVEYNHRWCWVNKILFVLGKADRPLRSSDMIELLLPLEPKLQWIQSHQRPQTFSAHLNRALRNKRVVACKRGGSHGYFYALPEWMDSKSRLLKKYEEKVVIG